MKYLSMKSVLKYLKSDIGAEGKTSIRNIREVNVREIFNLIDTDKY